MEIKRGRNPTSYFNNLQQQMRGVQFWLILSWQSENRKDSFGSPSDHRTIYQIRCCVNQVFKNLPR